MAFRTGLERTIAGVIRVLEFVNPSRDGDHVQDNKRFPEKDAWANAEFSTSGGQLSVVLKEGYTSDRGRAVTRTAAVSLHPILARQLRDFLDREYPDIDA